MLSTLLSKVVDRFRHSVLTCTYARAIDTSDTIPTQRGVRRIAQARCWTLLGVLCISLTVAPAYAVDNSKTLQSFAKNYINDSASYRCFDYIITQESHWNPKAKNDTSTAYGIGQLLSETSPNSFVQLLHTLMYMLQRYGTICNAMNFHQRHGWY